TEVIINDARTNDTIREMTGGRGADYAFEAVGLPAVREQAFDAIRPGGKLVLSGISPMGSGTNLPGAIMTRQEKSVHGSYYGSAHAAREFPLLAQLFASGRLPIDRLISNTYKLNDINQAYADLIAGRGARSIISFE